MKQLKLTIFAFAAILFGCQEAELVDPNDTGAVAMKTVTVSAGMDNQDTKASLDSQTGAFTWQSGDLISVLATDGKFYDFILEGEHGAKVAEFVGQIPEGYDITTVATYPRIVANGTENTVLAGNTLNYVLPEAWNYAKDVSNVPMVATFGEGAEHMSFKQVGGVMRFPVKNLPPKAQFVVTMADKTITGQFSVDITKLGEAAMVAGTEASVLTINYSSDVDGASTEFNVPVPTGTYNNFKVEVKDAEGTVLFEKNYTAENTVNRATLLNMKELVLPERPMVISEVWPFFVDARVVFNPYEGITDYAFYIDGADTPVILAAEDVNGGKVGALVGGNFSHNTTHTVAVAKVVEGEPVAASKSAEVTFTTADIRQLTNNTGTRFVAVGWDDVAISNGPKYVDGKWTAAIGCLNYERGYQVQLYASDKTTVLYDMIPFDGHISFQSPFSDTSFLGKTDNAWHSAPTALSFGWLDPGKDYYFRVKTLDESVMVDISLGNYNPTGEPYELYSQRGGCAWSEMVKLSTDSVIEVKDNLIFHEGFDDFLLDSDLMNSSLAVVPDYGDLMTPISKADYLASMKTAYPEFLSITDHNLRKFTVGDYHSPKKVPDYGMTGESVDGVFYLNSNAGSLEGWSYMTDNATGGLVPVFGAVRIGRGQSNSCDVTLLTPVIESDKLRSDVGTKCIVTLQLSNYATRHATKSIVHKVGLKQLRGSNLIASGEYSLKDNSEQWAECYLGTTTSDYKNNYKYFEVKHEFYLRNGDVIGIQRPTGDNGLLVLGDVKIEVVPGKYEDGINLDDTGIGTEPDDTNYDVYGLGEFPISYWYTVEPAAYTKYDANGAPYYDYELTKARYQEVKDAGMNIAMYYGHGLDYSIAEQKRILNILEEIDLHFIGSISSAGAYIPTAADVAAVKENLAMSDYYLGDLLRDEPNSNEFDGMGAYVDEYLQQLPNKNVYVNLFPIVASQNQLGTNTYEEYLDKYLEKVKTKDLSYDLYGLGTQSLNTQYYKNLDMARSKTLDRRMPYWMITQAGPVGASKMPNNLEQRWSVWSTIAGGSKGISYFCYWTPSGENFESVEYMITQSGEKTDMYNWVKQINEDINTIGKKLLPCHADGMILSLTGNFPLFDNNGRGRTHYGPVKGIKAKEAHLACGCFRDARRSMSGENYKGYKVLVTHEFPGLNLTDNFTATLNLDPAVTEITVTCRNTEKTLQLTNTLNEQITVDGLTFAVTYDGANLVLSMPEGEAMLVEF